MEFTCKYDHCSIRNEWTISLAWGAYRLRKVVKTLDDADKLRTAWRADCQRKFNSAQVCAAGRLD